MPPSCDRVLFQSLVAFDGAHESRPRSDFYRVVRVIKTLSIAMERRVGRRLNVVYISYALCEFTRRTRLFAVRGAIFRQCVLPSGFQCVFPLIARCKCGPTDVGNPSLIRGAEIDVSYIDTVLLIVIRYSLSFHIPNPNRVRLKSIRNLRNYIRNTCSRSIPIYIRLFFLRPILTSQVVM